VDQPWTNQRAVSLRRFPASEDETEIMPDDETRIEELDAPGADTSHEAERSLVTILTTDLNEVGVGLATMAAAYGAKKVIDKFREPPPDSGPKPNEGQGGEPGPAGESDPTSTQA
jgi:hypothetical protein